MKELLAELAMVEGEITRLESQIRHLQTDLDREKEMTRDSKSKQWKSGTLDNPHHLSSSALLPPNPNPTIKGFSEKKTFESKALHFISKAIKGDYNLSDFSIHEKLKNSRGFPDQKENHFHEVGFQERLTRKSGMLKPASPLRDPRHKTPKVRKLNACPFDVPKYVYTYVLIVCS